MTYHHHVQYRLFINLPNSQTVCEPRWRTSERNMGNRLGLGDNFFPIFLILVLLSVRRLAKSLPQYLYLKLWPNPNLVHILHSDVRHLGSHTSGVPINILEQWFSNGGTCLIKKENILLDSTLKYIFKIAKTLYGQSAMDKDIRN